MMASRIRLNRVRTFQYLVRLAFVTAPLLVTTGCFSLGLGERTTYVQETPETLQRISSLESRLQALEQMLHSAPVTAQPQSDAPEPLPAPIYRSGLPAAE